MMQSGSKDYFGLPIESLPMLPKNRLRALQMMELGCYMDILQYFPSKHLDRSRIQSVNEICSESEYVQLRVVFVGMRLLGQPKQQRLSVIVQDGTGRIELVFFKGLAYYQRLFTENKEFLVFGKPQLYQSQYNFSHPEVEAIKGDVVAKVESLGWQPKYSIPTKAEKLGMTSRIFSGLVQYVLKHKPEKIEETLPKEVIDSYHLMGRDEAYEQMHFPKSNAEFAKARYRIVFEEFFMLQTRTLYLKELRKLSIKGVVFSKVGEYFHRFYNEQLPFPLTEAQKRVIKEIREDTRSGAQMNRLVQGDVGSGKTIVALCVALIALDNNFQVCLMAPTEILATQHYLSFLKYLEPLNVNVQLLTGSSRSKHRRILSEGLVSGEVQILIGTHALIEEPVQYNNLGLVIIDEQHRFGVAQRAALWKKAEVAPHVLVMTATPIPRTLAMTTYGDLDLSIIDQLPPGRQPIETVHFFEKDRHKVYNFMRKLIAQGQQVYVVYPLIEESEVLDLQNIERGFQLLREEFPEHEGYALQLLHGRMTPAEKNAAMDAFKTKKANILVSTTVIEVGVDVPNATFMVIESAHRFGLAQLHQLRGRVGRGQTKSYCVLLTPMELSFTGRQRMKTMVDSSNGFVIAEADLKLRGPGDITGTQQSGLPMDLKVASLATDADVLHTAQEAAVELLGKDSTLKEEGHNRLKEMIMKDMPAQLPWNRIS